MINTKELVQNISKRTGLEKDTVRLIIAIMVKEVTESLKNKKKVRINDLGTFYPFVSTARNCNDPSNSGVIMVRPERIIPKFRRSHHLKNEVNGCV